MADNKKNSLVSLAEREREAVTDLMKGEYRRVTNVRSLSMPSKVKISLNGEDGMIESITAANGDRIQNPTFARALASEEDMQAFNLEIKEVYEELNADVSSTDEAAILDSVDSDIKDMAKSLEVELADAGDFYAKALEEVGSLEVVIKALHNHKRGMLLEFRENNRTLYALAYSLNGLNYSRFTKSLRVLNPNNVDSIMNVWAGLPYGAIHSYTVGKPYNDLRKNLGGLYDFLAEKPPENTIYTPDRIHSYMGLFPLHALAHFVEDTLTIPLKDVRRHLRDRVVYLADQTDFKAAQRVQVSQAATDVVKNWWAEKDFGNRLTQDSEESYFVVAANFRERGQIVKSLRDGKEGWLFLHSQNPNMHIWPCNADHESWLNGGVVIYCDPNVLEDIVLEYNLEVREQAYKSSPDKFYMHVPRDIYIPDLVKDLEADTRITEAWADRTLTVHR